ncbi:eukaryotic translation initiation factor 4 gamma-like protein [Euroglyphus maynei]|uniref:Eukaryotic translation initiation factor 4 gamma-like protein n=1 Tax=Euroglyphus maynei TaxID=6958 RepID=A0A1Y3BMV5_EURMA|nr:eukaryotic translation initiation factor 4 gamma-like protein [Euroglyphus maynei]
MYSNIEDLIQEVKSTEDPEKRKILEEQLDDEKMHARKRSVGNIKFIAELFKLNMLNASIMFSCFEHLFKHFIDHNHEEYIECLCALITNIGKNLTEQIKMKYPDHIPNFDKIFNQLEKIYNEELDTKVSPRIRFMILDLLDLRKNQWVPRRKTEGPKLIAQSSSGTKNESNSSFSMFTSGSHGGSTSGSQSRSSSTNYENKSSSNDKNQRYQRIGTALKEYLDKQDYGDTYKNVQSFCSKTKCADFIAESILLAIDKTSQKFNPRERWGQFLGQFFCSSFCENTDIFESLKTVFAQYEEIKMDLPNFFQFVAEVIAHASLVVYEKGSTTAAKNDIMKAVVFQMNNPLPHIQISQ